MYKGLKSTDALIRLKNEGLNTLSVYKRNSIFSRIKKMLKEPMFALLILASIVYISIGDLTDGITLSFFVLSILFLTLYQEGKSENSINALKDLNQPFTMALRDGEFIKLPSKNIVRDDIIKITEGDRVPADGRLIESSNLEVDESLLTGESLPVLKKIITKSNHKVGLYSGTFVICGHGLFQVEAVGMNTKFGKIGHSLNSIQSEETPLHKQTSKLVNIIAIIGLILCLGMITVLGIRTGEWIQSLLAGIALAMAILPEEYPVVLAIFPALGAQRLAGEGVLVRRIDAIETLGATTILCTDKTGTLTKNLMTVQALAIMRNKEIKPHVVLTTNSKSIPNEYFNIIKNSILASAEIPTDQMEIAFHNFVKNISNINSATNYNELKLYKSYPLTSEIKAMCQIWQNDEGSQFIAAAKGAPESIMKLCNLSGSDLKLWTETINELAIQGMRVLAVAEGNITTRSWPEKIENIHFKWNGLIGLSDPIRDEVPQAMTECKAAGIKVIMITGDYPATAQAIAKQAGMPANVVITGDELDQIKNIELREIIKSVNICARISPIQKLRIIEALKHNGEIVTMTGDGINDAPALLSAHVGVAMGMRGTDVAREAADLVLIDDNFASIVRAIRVGRRIFSNMKKSMAYIFAIHIPIALLALIPMLLYLPPLFLPVHIALLEMVIDPACSVIFESEPENPFCMQIPPRNVNTSLFNLKAIIESLMQGMWVFLSVVLCYLITANILGNNYSDDSARSMMIIAFMTANISLVFISKSEGYLKLTFLGPINWPAVVISIITVIIILAAIYVPFISTYLKFDQLALVPLFASLACGTLGLFAHLIKHNIND